MQAKNVVVYSPFLFKNNCGDLYFMDAFKELFPEFNFTFLEEVKNEDVDNADAFFLGGGSFLDAKPLISDECLKKIINLPIFYIGVGTETHIDPIHIQLMKSAKLIATRSKEKVVWLQKEINKNSFYCPDIVYCLQDKAISYKKDKISKSLIILPNIAVVPNAYDPMWKHSAWNYFKSEFCQFIDELNEQHYKISYFGMCQNNQLDDYAASAELISFTKKRKYNNQLAAQPNDFKTVCELLSQYEVMITQRFHGIVLAEMLNIPYLSVHHHDKLKNSYPNSGKYLDYYGVGKSKLFDEFYSSLKMKKCDFLPIETNTFKELKEKVKCWI